MREGGVGLSVEVEEVGYEAREDPACQDRLLSVAYLLDPIHGQDNFLSIPRESHRCSKISEFCKVSLFRC